MTFIPCVDNKSNSSDIFIFQRQPMMSITCNFSFTCRLVSSKELLFYGSCQVRSVQAEHPLVPLCPKALKRTILLLQHHTMQCYLAKDMFLSPSVGCFKFHLNTGAWCIITKAILAVIIIIIYLLWILAPPVQYLVTSWFILLYM